MPKVASLNVFKFGFRALREKWESFGDELTECQRNTEVCLLQWSSYDDSFDQLHKWLVNVEAKLLGDAGLKATLHEKKQQLQTHKVGYLAFSLSYMVRNVTFILNIYIPCCV